MTGIVKPGLILFAITIVAAMCLGFVYDITKEPIAEQIAIRQTAAMKEILPSANSFDRIEIYSHEVENFKSAFEGKTSSGETSGYIFNMNTKGYGGDIDMLVGVDGAGTITGVRIVSQSETPGLGANAVKPAFYEQYNGKSNSISVVKSAPGSSDIQAITSATITSEAVTKGVNAALTAYKDLMGGVAK